MGCDSDGFCEEGLREFWKFIECGKVCRGGSSGIGEEVLGEGRGGRGGKGEFCDCEVSLVTAEVGSESDEA